MPGAYQVPFCGILPQICKENMVRRLAKRRATKYGIGSVQDVLPSTPPAWVHCCDHRYMAKVVGGNSEDAPPLCNTGGASTAAPMGMEPLSGPRDSLQQSRSSNLGGRQVVFLPNVAFTCPGLATMPKAMAYRKDGGPPVAQHPSVVPPRLDTVARGQLRFFSAK
jgi:hypothetical protein